MISKIIAYSAKYKFLVMLFVLVAIVASYYSLKHSSLDALPDLSDTQVVIYSQWDRSPDIIEDQVTYPITSALLGVPKVKAIRGFSDFGFSYVYAIFEDGTDVYWARSRVLEYMSKIQSQLPPGVKTELGPDATGVGWVFQYALVDKSGQHSLAELRSYQDWTLRYQLQSVPGVAEVASIGGYQKQYQVQINPNALGAYHISLSKVTDAIRQGNNDVGGRLIEMGGAEYMVRGRGYAKRIEDIEQLVVGKDPGGTPILIKNIATVEIGPEIRRGVADLDGQGDTVGGIVVVRYHENALQVIDRVKQKLADVKSSLPPGVEIVTTYDRADLIRRAMHTLREELLLELIVVSLIILLFLWHIPSALIAIVTIPIAVFLTFIPMYWMGLTINIMSLSGIAISIGVLVDGAIVEVENAYKRLQEWITRGRQGDFHAVRLKALQEVGPSVFFSLLVIAVAFLPIFTLVDQEGRLFRPLAMTKNLSMFMAAILAVTFDPALRMFFSRMEGYRFKPRWLSRLANGLLVGKYYPEEKHPVSRVLHRIYEPACRWVLRHPLPMIGVAVVLLLSTIYPFMKLGSEFMPPLNEGSILYMPTTLPGLAISEAQRLLQSQDQILKSFPEVERVFGKAGRADTATDPAPFSMFETTVILKPPTEWRKKSRFYSGWPEIFQIPLRHIWYDRMSYEDLVGEMDQKLQYPGMSNAWTMPIKNRIDMLSTGIRTPIGIKIFGANLARIEQIGLQIESTLRQVPGTRSVFAERTAGGYFLDINLKRQQLARYGLSIAAAEDVIMSAIGGEPISQTYEGRERYGISVRYAREWRDNPEKLQRVLVATESGAQIPLAQIADISFCQGPAMIRNENGMLSGYVYVDVAGRDIGSYIKEAKQVVNAQIKMPQGYSLQWSGQYENMARVKARLKLVIPLTFFIIFTLLYLNTQSITKTLIVLLAVPFSLIGAIWFLYFLDYNLSIAVWVGMIALMGLDAETGVFMLLFLDMAYNDRVAAHPNGHLPTAELHNAIIDGAVKRLRPKLMTVSAAFIGLLPIMWSLGTGADLMKRIAAPMIGGLVTSFGLELLVYPALYLIWKRKEGWRTEARIMNL